MFFQNRSWAFTLSVVLVLPSLSATGQVPGRGGVGGSRIGSGAPGQATPRSGLGIRSNPIVNPAPSLTPSQVLNPRGSLNTGQVLNPQPSPNRPRTGVSAPGSTAAGASPQSISGASNYRAASPNLNQASAEDVGPAQATSGRRDSRPLGTQLLELVVELDAKVTEVAPDKGWSERLSLDDLRGVPVFSQEPSDEDERKRLTEILKVYQDIAQNEKNAAINQLPEFKRTMSLIQDYLTPVETRRRRDMPLAFDLFYNQLRKYKNGAEWAEYLSLPDDTESDAGKARITKLASRFDKLVGDKAYDKVTNLPGFDAAHATLHAVVSKLE